MASIPQDVATGESQPVIGNAGAEALPLHFQLECLLFVSQEPASVERLAAVLDVEPADVEAATERLGDEYRHRGLRIQRTRGRIQLVTAPEAADLVRRFLGLEFRGRLSPAALETLAIVAYQQPTTRAQIETVRGVNSDSVLRTLVNHGLIDAVGRLEQAGRPILYGTTFEFLQEFGLSSLDQLPPLASPHGSDEPVPQEAEENA